MTSIRLLCLSLLIASVPACKTEPAKQQKAAALCAEDPFPRTATVGETTVEYTLAVLDGQTALVQRITARDRVVAEVTMIPGTPVGNEMPFTIRGEYSPEFFDGIGRYELTTRDAVWWEGTVDGKRVLPFNTAAAMLDDGSPFPTVTPRLPHLIDEANRASEIIIGPNAPCANPASQTRQAMLGGAAGKAGRPNCESCRTKCDVVFFGMLASGFLCSAFSICPPCAAVCVAIVVADAFIAMKLCSDFCEGNVCNGPACGGSSRCEAGGDCARPSLREDEAVCCPAGTKSCGYNAGSLEHWQCCGGGETCAAAEARCCYPPEKAIGGKCCPESQQWKTPAGGDVCCAHAPCADGSCCELGSCVAGTCCPTPCAGKCCGGAGDRCIAATCCPTERQCGTVCCGDGLVCLDEAGGRCGLAPSISCPPGTVVKVDLGHPGAFTCCAPEQAGCNGACCALGTMCCAAGGATASCRTDCIR